MGRTKLITELLTRYTLDTKLRDAVLDDLNYGEEEIPFSNLCAIIRNNKITPTPEDKRLIDEIGESLWNGGQGQYRMVTKYWKDIVQ